MKIEKTVSFQIENAQGGYCSTVYSLADARLVKSLAEAIPHLRCLNPGKQVSGIYIYKTRRGKREPLVEVYDSRLAKKVRANIRNIKGD